MPAPFHLLERGEPGLFNFNMTLIAQIINFLLLMFLLAKFAYKPLLQMMEERRSKIASDLEAAEQDKLAAAKMKEEYEQQIADAREQAQVILERANKLAAETQEEIIRQAREEHERLLKSAQDQIERERQKALSDLRGEVVSLSMLAAAKLVGRNMDSEADAKLVQNFIDKLDDASGSKPC